MQAGEREVERSLGVTMPMDDATRHIYSEDAEGEIPDVMSDAPIQTGDLMPVDKYMTLPQAGTVLITHYDTFHRGSPRLPNSLWRPMIRMKFFRVSEPDVSGISAYSEKFSTCFQSDLDRFWSHFRQFVDTVDA